MKTNGFELPQPVTERLRKGINITLELGCGKRKRHPDALGVDLIRHEGVDIQGDIYEVLQAFPDKSISAVFAYHCLEHLPDLKAVMVELDRILKKNAYLKIVVPHFSNPYFFSDSSHKTFFGLYTLCYFSADSPFRRHVPTYDTQLGFKIRKIKLIFKSPRPFYFRWGLKKLLQTVFNSAIYLTEFYEENLCYWFPCYEIQYELSKE